MQDTTVLSADPVSPERRGNDYVTLCVPKTSSTSCDQVIFVDQATDVCLFPDAVQIEINRFG